MRSDPLAHICSSGVRGHKPLFHELSSYMHNRHFCWHYGFSYTQNLKNRIL